MTQQYSFGNCMTTKPWYHCPLASIVFAFFILLFAYSIYMMIANFKMIQFYTDKLKNKDEQEENVHKLKEFEVLFVINIIGAFISFAVIVTFLGKVLHDLTFMKFFNKYLIIIIIIFLMIIGSWNIHVYRGERGKVNTGVQITNGIIVGLCSAIVLFSIIFYFYQARQQQHSKKPQSTN